MRRANLFNTIIIALIMMLFLSGCGKAEDTVGENKSFRDMMKHKDKTQMVWDGESFVILGSGADDENTLDGRSYPSGRREVTNGIWSAMVIPMGEVAIVDDTDEYTRYEGPNCMFAVSHFATFSEAGFRI